MICPRDQQPLQQRRNDGYLLHFCPECHGVFVKMNQSGSPGITSCTIKPEQQPKITVPEDEHALSPVSGKPMLVFRHKGVLIDYCPNSCSVWLDAGELDKIADTSSRTKAKSKSGLQECANAADGGLFIVEFAAEAVVALLSW